MVAPASCRLSRGRLALAAAGEDARRTAAETTGYGHGTSARTAAEVRCRIRVILSVTAKPALSADMCHVCGRAVAALPSPARNT